EGGIAGRGVGGIVIDDGVVTASTEQKSCSGTLTAEEREELSKLAAIRESYARGNGSPDQIHYTLIVGKRTATWFGEEAPKEIASLFRALWRIRQRVLAG
ncbi:MAG: hypothetical protein QOE82_219, partial [Thermoanaerobaculia bacterium]|nr:hypothetical protein [Thermoanaerobaculia bacterium]